MAFTFGSSELVEVAGGDLAFCDGPGESKEGNHLPRRNSERTSEEVAELEALKAKLSPGQVAAIEAIKDWYQNGTTQVYRMFGQAGTGKTTIARLVPYVLSLDDVLFGAFSGKAAQVLRSKGCVPSGTLHSMLYTAPQNLEAARTRQRNMLQKLEEMDVRDEILITAVENHIKELTSMIRANGALYWPTNFESPLADAQLLIADEVSMVSDKMADDILATGVRVLVLGDPEQLPPIRGEGYFTSQAPDIMLTEVHRQALDSPVIALATRVRNGGMIHDDEYAHGKRLDYTKFDQILCWRRATRWGAIGHVRKALGRQPGVPVPGDPVMNLQNNKDLDVFNGQTFTVLEVQPGREEDELLLTLEDGAGEVRDIFSFIAGFTQNGENQALKARIGWNGQTALFTFSHALTVHKAQGSEWGNVCLVDEGRAMWGMEYNRIGSAWADEITRRWRYTGITRASKDITLVRK
jgi:exodeoxyribonuclease-5